MNYKRILSLTICSAMLFTACGNNTQIPEVTEVSSETDEAVDTQDSGADTIEFEAAETETEESEKCVYVYDPYVSNSMLDDVLGEEKREVYLRFLEAVDAGRDYIEVDDLGDFNWGIGTYTYACNPVLNEYIETIDNEIVDGIGHFRYKIPYDELQVKIQEFKEIVDGILSETMKEDYSDMEKALSLYIYFVEHYEYDYEAEELMKTEYLGFLSPYRLLTEGKGICQEISNAYSYLLMLAGVDASVTMGDDHMWSYVCIDGNYYHIDPTFAISSSDVYLGYFMMTDDQRSFTGYSYDEYVFISSFTQVRDTPPPVYYATDDTYKELWDCFLVDFDPENNVLTTDMGTFTY